MRLASLRVVEQAADERQRRKGTGIGPLVVELREWENLVCSVEYYPASGHAIIVGEDDMGEDEIWDAEKIATRGVVLNPGELALYAKWWIAKHRATVRSFDGLGGTVPAEGEPASRDSAVSRDVNGISSTPEGSPSVVLDGFGLPANEWDGRPEDTASADEPPLTVDDPRMGFAHRMADQMYDDWGDSL